MRWRVVSLGLASAEQRLSIYFSVSPSPKLEFSNDTGAAVHCAADGNPTPEVSWETVDRTPLIDIPNLRKFFANGTLYFFPFPASSYREDVHAMAYVCVASNFKGAIVSNQVHVRAVVNQQYEVQIYDQFVIDGNTGLLTCHIPSFVEEYIDVVSWITDDGTIIPPLDSGSRMVGLSHGGLYISNVIPSDEKRTFRCKTVNRLTGETKMSSPGRVGVTDPQSSMPPRISHTKPSVQALQGQRVELLCASQGFPVPNYRWFKLSDGELISLSSEGRLRQWASLLVVTRVQLSDSGVYRCVTTNSIGEDSAETTLRVIAPFSVQVSPRIQLVDLGKSTALTCTANGYPPMTSFTWFKNGKPILADMRIGFTSAKILTITEAERGDQGMYQCFVCYDQYSAFDVAEVRLGRVFPTIISHFSHQAVVAGAKVSLKCVATSNSSPTIVWTRDDLPIKPSAYSSFVTSAGDVISHLNITSVRVEDGGEYRCIASNRAGETSHTAKLNIIGPPFIRPMKNVTVVSGHTAVVTCRVTGYPIRSVTWRKGDIILPVDPRQEVHANGTMQMTSVDKNFDEGTYTCTATNDRGESASGTVAITVTATI